jgi:hypothetical protein
VRELQTGLWHWEAPHPEWEPSEPWQQVVSSYAIDDGDRLLVFDRIAPPGEIDELAGRRETAIMLTAPWHERDTRSLVERLSVPVLVPPPDEGSPDVAWLLAGERARRTCTRPATVCPPESRRSREGSRTTSSSGSRITVRLSPATRSSTSAEASRFRSSGSARA